MKCSMLTRSCINLDLQHVHGDIQYIVCSLHLSCTSIHKCLYEHRLIACWVTYPLELLFVKRLSGDVSSLVLSKTNCMSNIRNSNIGRMLIPKRQKKMTRAPVFINRYRERIRAKNKTLMQLCGGKQCFS